ncbi:MAG: oligosaccharide flippase family protein [Bacteroidetes bacterium]|nr:oligosaccharide flippase family protein [Bacteroidota bacterium]
MTDPSAADPPNEGSTDAPERRARGTALWDVARQSGVYALGNIALKASGLLIAPLYLNPELLTVEGFGQFALLNVTAQLAIFIVGLGLGQGLLKFVTDPDLAHKRQALPFTTLTATLGAVLVGCGLLAALADPLTNVLLGAAAPSTLLVLVAGYVGAKVMGSIPLMLLRARERAGWYATAVGLEALVLVGAVYYFLAVLQWGLWGLMAAYAASATVGTIVLLVAMLRLVPWSFDRTLVLPLIRFGWPLAVGALAAWFLNLGDRYLLSWLVDDATTGLYEWAARLAGAVNMLFVQSFQLAFSVIGLKALGRGDAAADLHRTIFRHYVAVTGWASLGIALLAYDLTRLLTAEATYLEAEPLVLLLALGFMAYGVHFIITNVLYAAGKTGTMGSLVLAAAVLNLLLNLALIPFIGAVGAALTTYVSYLALALGNAYVAGQTQAVAFPWGRYAGVVVLVVALYAVGWTVQDAPPAVRLSVRLGLIAAFPPLLVVTRFYTWREVRTTARLLRDYLRAPQQ